MRHSLYISNTGVMACVLFCLTVSAQKEVPYTLEDRDRAIRTEIKVNEIDKRFEQIDKRFEQIEKRFEQIDKRFEQIEKRFEQIERRLNEIEASYQWQFGILLSAMFVLVGFILWDRRTFLKPFEIKVTNMEETLRKEQEKTDALLGALRELAKKNKEVEQVLREFHLL